MKKCSRCGEEKPQSDFYSNRSMKDNLGHYCKKCFKNFRLTQRLSKKSTEELNRLLVFIEMELLRRK